MLLWQFFPIPLCREFCFCALDIINRVLYTDRTLYGCCWQSLFHADVLQCRRSFLKIPTNISLMYLMCLYFPLTMIFHDTKKRRQMWVLTLPLSDGVARQETLSNRYSSSFVEYRCRKSKAKPSRVSTIWSRWAAREAELVSCTQRRKAFISLLRKLLEKTCPYRKNKWNVQFPGRPPYWWQTMEVEIFSMEESVLSHWSAWQMFFQSRVWDFAMDKKENKLGERVKRVWVRSTISIVFVD